jgi:hypothetical protein
MSRSSRSQRRVFWGWAVEMPLLGSNPKPNQNADVGVPEAGVRRKGRTADRGTRKAIANVVTGNRVGAVDPPGGTVVGNGRVEIEGPVVVMEERVLDRPQ